MARVISEKTHSYIVKLLKNSIKTVKNDNVKIHLNMLLADIEDAEIAIGYDD